MSEIDDPVRRQNGRGLWRWLAHRSSVERSEGVDPSSRWIALGSEEGDMSYRFVGDLQGLSAIAIVELEQLHSYAVMSGDVRSPNAHYGFTADIYGDGGYGDMSDRMTGERFRIQISNLSEAGFVLTANPFEGVSSTSYVFRRSG